MATKVGGFICIYFDDLKSQCKKLLLEYFKDEKEILELMTANKEAIFIMGIEGESPLDRTAMNEMVK